MKTINLQLSSQSATQNYNTEGTSNGGSTSINYRLVVVEDNNNQVGDANFSFNMNIYSLSSDNMEYTAAMETLNAKIKAAIQAFNQALTGKELTSL